MNALFAKFNPIPRDLKIFTMPLVIGWVKRSHVICPTSLRAQSLHNLVGYDTQVVTEGILYI